MIQKLLTKPKKNLELESGFDISGFDILHLPPVVVPWSDYTLFRIC